MAYCRHCLTPEEVEPLFSKPLRDLTPADLGPYFSNAICTAGQVSDFKHFLPRVAQLLLQARSVELDLFGLCQSLRAAAWRDWPEVERRAVEGWLDLAWRVALGSDESPIDVYDCIHGFREADLDLAPYLEVWRQEASAGATALLIGLVLSCEDTEARRFVENRGGSLWKHHPVARQTLLQWLEDPETLARIQRAAQAEPGGTRAQRAAAILASRRLRL